VYIWSNQLSRYFWSYPLARSNLFSKFILTVSQLIWFARSCSPSFTRSVVNCPCNKRARIVHLVHRIGLWVIEPFLLFSLLTCVNELFPSPSFLYVLRWRFQLIYVLCLSGHNNNILGCNYGTIFSCGHN